MQVTEWIAKHWPILVVLIPLISAPLIILLKSKKNALIITRTIAIINLVIAPLAPVKPYSYSIGDWIPPIGIEYVLDEMNYLFIILMNIILLLFCTNLKPIENKVLNFIEEGYENIFFAVLVLAHAGFTGILITGDIFNAYVFIEISSLASYALISMNKNKYASVSALEYLIIGTIAATFILIGIGMIFSITGTLNMKHIATLLSENYSSKISKIGILLIIAGILIKVAIFPLNFWMIRAYNAANSTILTYIAAISPISGFYLLIRIIHSVIGWDIFNSLGLNTALSIMGCATIITFSSLTIKSYRLKNLILFSSAIQIGYLCIMIANSQNISQIIQYICADSLMKFILFYFLAQLESEIEIVDVQDLYGIAKKYPTLSITMTLNIISNMGLPITVGFFNKMNLLNSTIQNKQFWYFAAIIIASVVAIEFNFRILRNMYLGEKQDAPTIINQSYISLVCATSVSFLLIFCGKI